MSGAGARSGAPDRRPIHTRGALDGRIRVPGSRSIANRALVCAALAPGSSLLRGISESDDTAAMRESATTEEYRLTRVDEPNFVSGHLPFVITREHVVIEPPPLAHHA